MDINIKSPSQLNKEEVKLLNYWREKEFQTKNLFGENFSSPFSTDLFFILTDEKKIKAFGRIINPTIYIDTKPFEIFGIGSIISIDRKKGYGKKLMESIREYINTQGKTGIGFCGKINTEFYRKCALEVISGQKQFIYIDHNELRHPGNNYEDTVYLRGKDGVVELLLKGKEAIYYCEPW